MRVKGSSADMDYGTRLRRRNAVKSILACLLAIRDAELKYLKNVPDNLQSSESFEAGEYAVDVIGDAIDLLVDAY